MNLTFGMIKPDAVERKLSGKIIEMIELNGFAIQAFKKVQLTQEEAEIFYAIHKDRPFFNSMIKDITAGPVIGLLLEKENAVADWRALMGATNPKDASLGTIRKMFAKDISYNSVHGSDSVENAQKELEFFFPEFFGSCCQEC